MTRGVPVILGIDDKQQRRKVGDLLFNGERLQLEEEEWVK